MMRDVASSVDMKMMAWADGLRANEECLPDFGADTLVCPTSLRVDAQL